MTQATVSNITPRAILSCCVSTGINVDRFLAEIGINKEAVNDSNGRTSFEDIIKLWDASAKITQNRMFGLDTSFFLPFGAIKVIDFVMITSQTAKESLSKFVRYYTLINRVFSLGTRTKGEFTHLQLHNPTDPNFFPVQYIDYIFAAILTRLRITADMNLNPSELHFTCSAPKDLDKYYHVFRAPIKFNQRVNQMIIAKDMLNMVQPYGDPHLCEMLDCHAQKLINQLPSNKDILLELRAILRQGLYLGETGIDNSAKKLGISRRNLQRKLKSRGISYRTLLDQIRCDLAQHLLSKQGESIEATAYLIGYSEQTSFYRAFKRWTGKTPQEFCKTEIDKRS